MAEESEIEEVKAGARNSSADKARIRQLRQHGREIDRITRELEPEDEDGQEEKTFSPETPTYFGEAVKALGEGKVGGYLVRYSDPRTPDLTGDFFDAATDYGISDGATLPVYYQHGMDGVLKNRRIGRGLVKYDEAGLWLEAQLEMRDEYERMIYELAQTGKLGWSSGATSHLVDREPVGKSYHIKSWPIGEASLTPTPAEPRNSAVPIKSLPVGDMLTDSNQQAGEAGEDNPATVGETTLPNLESQVKGVPMDEIEVKTIAEQAAQEAVKAYVASLPTTNAGGVQVVKDEADQPFASLGEQLKAVMQFYTSNGMQSDRRLTGLKALGANEGVPSEGGFLVQTDFVAGLLKPMHDAGPFSSRVRRIPVSAGANGLTMNAVNETSRATGSRWGGVQGYRLAEAGTKLASKPAFRRMELRLKKYIVAAYATDELLQDQNALESVLRQAAGEEFDFMVNDDIMNGLGVAGPLGFMASHALVTVAKEAGQAADSIVPENIQKMFSRLHPRHRANAAWFINVDCEPQLNGMNLNMGVSAMPAYMPPGGLSSAPYATLLGRPVIPTEFNATIGDLGDIVLADLSEYIMIEKGGVQSASSIHVQFMTDETTFRFVYRCDGQPAWNAPVTPYKGSNALSPFVTLAERA